MKLIRIEFPPETEDLVKKVKYVNIDSAEQFKQKLSSTFGNKILIFDLSGAAVVDTTPMRYQGLLDTSNVNRMLKSYKINLSQVLGIESDKCFNEYDIAHLKQSLSIKLREDAKKLLNKFY